MSEIGKEIAAALVKARAATELTELQRLEIERIEHVISREANSNRRLALIKAWAQFMWAVA